MLPRIHLRSSPHARPRMAIPDPRHTVTPDAFSVAPALLGLPLARPSRRLAAMLLDLLLVAILAGLGGFFLLGIAAAYAFFRFAGRFTGEGGGWAGRSARLGFRAAGALVLFVLAVGTGRDVVRWAGNTFSRGLAVQVDRADGTTGTARMGTSQISAFTTELPALRDAGSEEEGRRRAARAVAALREMGMDDEQVTEALEETTAGAAQPWMPEVVAEAVHGRTPAAEADPVPADSLVQAYAAALVAGDTAASQALAPKVGSIAARDSLDRLASALTRARRENRALEERAEAAEESGVVAWIVNLLDEMGIGLGWTGLYFTAFGALGKGQTPAKRLLKIRVVRLNGQPMTLWMSFERFGGYAAGLVTGLLGFAQVYWDKNRQMIHDKIVETVVIREGKPLARPPAAPLG